MLVHVSANQARYMAPGLSPDPRGIALGRYSLTLLSSLDRVVGFFRGLSEKMSLDDLLGGLKIYQVKSSLQSRELIVLLPASNSHTTDRAAALATLLGGLTFTGSAKHFVKYRDSRSPMGYDVDTLHSDACDFILYHTDFVQTYTKERELPFAPLVFNLSLLPLSGDQMLPGEQVLLRVEPGLWRAVLSYLHRRGCTCDVAACEREAAGGTATGQPRRYYLIRGQLDPRMYHLFSGTPGIELFRFLNERVAVQVGFKHPLVLSSCSSIFKEGSFYLFASGTPALDILPEGPRFTSATTIVQLSQEELLPREVGQVSGHEVEELSLSLRLAPATGEPQRIFAARIPHQQQAWLKKLVFLLPPTLFSQYQICFSEQGLFLYAETGLDYIPLGELFTQGAPGVFVSAGCTLLPRLEPQVMLEHLAGSAESYFFFSRHEPHPLRLAKTAFVSLARRTLARIEVPTSPHEPGPSSIDPAVRILNDPLGVFPLWSFREHDGES